MPNASRKRTRRRLVELACICLAVAQLGWFVFPRIKPFIEAELNSQDQIIANGRRLSLGEEFVFVEVDEASVELDQIWDEDIEASPTLRAMADSGFPWPRSVYADAVEKLLGAGARIVILDFLFNAASPHDAALRAVLDAHPDKVVIGSNFSRSIQAGPDGNRVLANLTTPTDTLIESPADDPRVGYVNFWPGYDDTVRQVRFHTTISETIGLIPNPGEAVYPSLAAATLHQLGLDRRIPDTSSAFHFRFGVTQSLVRVPFYELFVPSLWEKNLQNGAIFRDKIVMIGPSAPRFQDFHKTPVHERMEGPVVHINAIAAALDGAYYQVAGPQTDALLTALMALTALVIAARVRSPIFGLTLLVAVSGLYLGMNYMTANLGDYLLPVRNPIMVLLTAGVCCIAWNFAQARRESGRMRSMLERYVSRNLVREVLDNREDFFERLGGTRQPVTVFFSDVRGFTSFSESADASNVVEQLNEYLGEMVGVIFRHAGTIDKFMGDGIMAVWGNVVSEGPASDTSRAIHAALEMQARIAALNERWQARNLRPFTVGMGLHHGEAVFGNIGSDEKMEPTVIGDTVNLASRVEGLTKKYGVDICVTQPAAELVLDQFLFRSVDLVQVVGKSHPVEILAVLGPRDMPQPEWLKRYEAAIADFRARRFAEAAKGFRDSLAEVPDDRLCAIYLERSERFLAVPPPEGWIGTEIATSK